MDKIPFTVYDFFAYLSSGSIWLATTDYIFSLGLMTRERIAPAMAILLVVLAYVCGHIVAHFSSFILEQWIVGRVLKRPINILLGGEPRWKVLKLFFPHYFRGLPEGIQERVRTQAQTRGIVGNGEGLFLHAYSIVAKNGAIQARLDEFRNQYGFARNMSLAFLSSSLVILVSYFASGHLGSSRWIWISAAAGLALFYRYLKFFRQYSYELLIRYSELQPPGEGQTT